MYPIILKRLLLVIAITCTGDVLSASPQQTANRLLDLLRETNQVPGMAAAVHYRGQLLWQGQTGYADVEQALPVTESTRFGLASVSKLITVTLLAGLIEQRQLALSDRVGEYLPEIPTALSAISLEQLAAHTSGIQHYNLVQRASNNGPYTSAVEALELFINRPLAFTPGSGYLYSSSGYTLLSAVMEKAASQRFDDQVRGLAKQLELNTLAANRVNQPRREDSMQYAVSADGSVQQLAVADHSFSWAGAGLGSSASDLAAFGAAHFDGSVISAGLFQRLLQPVVTNAGATVGTDWYRVAVGWRIGSDYHGRHIVHHSGINDGMRSILLLYPDEQLSVALLSNARWTSQMEFSAAMLAAAFLSDGEQAYSTTCDVGDYQYAGQFDDQNISGKLVLSGLTSDSCGGVLQVDANALGQWLNQYRTKTSTRLPVLMINDSGNQRFYALITPVALFPMTWMHVADDEIKISSQLGSRLLQLRAN